MMSSWRLSVGVWVHSLEYTYKCEGFVILHSVGTPVSVLYTMFTSVFVVDNTLVV